MTDPLYPIPRNDEATKFIFARARPDRDERGTMLLAATLSAGEREVVHGRIKQIAPSLANAKPAELRKALLEVFPDEDKDAAKKRAAALAGAMQGLPLFAVRRAALKLSQAGVRAPDRVQLRTEAEAVARPYWNEVSVGSLLLHARKKPGATPNEAERERVIAGFEALSASLAQRAEDGEVEGRACRTDRLMAEHRGLHVSDYEAEGLAPVFADPDAQIVVSLPLLLSLGWRIEEVGGRNVLLRPTGEQEAGER